jgi:hypothetical protein
MLTSLRQFASVMAFWHYQFGIKHPNESINNGAGYSTGRNVREGFGNPIQ